MILRESLSYVLFEMTAFTLYTLTSLVLAILSAVITIAFSCFLYISSDNEFSLVSFELSIMTSFLSPTKISLLLILIEIFFSLSICFVLLLIFKLSIELSSFIVFEKILV